ncbi:MAG: hypothetical protein CM15mP103_00930 [Gammaproteobacteria bacterium]|nr:MAG: hypothetical protein CM15mP103_00930 [Gammaproteobacteria bacterium]
MTLTGRSSPQEKISQTIGSQTITFSGQQIVNFPRGLGIFGGAGMFCMNPADPPGSTFFIGLAFGLYPWRYPPLGGMPGGSLLNSLFPGPRGPVRPGVFRFPKG